jgi:hypothetical protein
MKSIKMKLTISTLAILLCLGLTAQREDGADRRAVIHEKKMAYCNEQASLSESEAADYWAIDEALMEEKKALRKEAKGNRLDLETATDVEIEASIRANLEAKIMAEELELEYLDRFLEVLSAKKIALIKESERSFKKEVLRDLKRTPPSPRAPRERN